MSNIIKQNVFFVSLRCLFISCVISLLQACSETTTDKTPDEDGSSDTDIPFAILCDPDATISKFIPVTAIAATPAADFTSGAFSIITGDINGQFTALNNLNSTTSDITIATYGNHFYQIERHGGGNSITKYAINDHQVVIWQYSVNDPGATVVSNPSDMIFVSETKAYVLRYNKTRAWIVNPSATNEADFKIGELDLSAYGGIDGIPEMDGAVIVNGKLFVTVQRLEGATLQPDNISYLAVFDIATDQEIDVGINGDIFKGIPLQVRNPTNILYDKASDKIYIQGSGSTLEPFKYVGGIETIDATSYVSNFILDDGDDVNHPYGIIFKMALVSSDLLYFVGYEGYRDNTLYLMNLQTLQVARANVAQLINGDIAGLAVDPQGLLWVSDSANATVRILNPLSCEEIDAVSTNLNPAKIVFAQ